MVLDVQSLTAGYGGAPVLRNVELTVGAGSAVVLLGPNGAGKTTLLRTLAGLVKPLSGTITFDGAVINRLRPVQRSRRGLCMLPEGRGIFASLTVRENLVLVASPRKADAAVAGAVELFPALASRLNQRAGSMSGGEQQMLALVRACLAGPKLVMVDEASLGLSPLMVDRVFEAFRAIQAAGTALLIVEQYVARALEIADRVYLLNRGAISASGASSDFNAGTIFNAYLGIDTNNETSPQEMVPRPEARNIETTMSRSSLNSSSTTRTSERSLLREERRS